MYIGSHVSMKGKEMFIGSVNEASSYGSTAMMIYTGAPQNTRRKELSELKIEEGTKLRLENQIMAPVVHAPYIVNLANDKDKEKQQFAIDFLAKEMERAAALGAEHVCLHPGSHVGLGVEKGIENIVYGLNQVLTSDEGPKIALETMAGKGTELGRNFDELAQMIAGVNHPERISITLDTCHLNDAGYDVKNHFSDVLAEFDDKIGIDKIGVVHVNDSKNELGAGKDRHENIGFGTIGFDALYEVVHEPRFAHLPKILETPYVGKDKKTAIAPYKKEIEMLKSGNFDANWRDKYQ